MSTFDKPFRTYEEQILKLKTEHGLIISDDEIAKQLLCTISYYDLINGYKECFMKNDKFYEGITIEYLFGFCTYDKDLQNILLKYSIYVENIFKTKLAYIIAKNFGVAEKEYLKKENYDVPFEKDKKFKEVYKNIVKVLNHPKTDNPTKYYRNNHNHIPPWILLKNVYFNDTIDLYSFLPIDLKREIVNEYYVHKDFNNNEELELFMAMITIVRKFRNKIAHGGKVITYKCTGNVEIHLKNYKKISHNNFLTDLDIKYGKGKRDLYSMILSLMILLNNSQLLISFVSELIFILEIAPELTDTYSRISNLPPKLNKRLKVLYEYLTK